MYSVPKPVSAIRTRIRQEFERHRFVNKLSVVDVLIFRSHADYQVSCTAQKLRGRGVTLETVPDLGHGGSFREGANILRCRKP